MFSSLLGQHANIVQEGTVLLKVLNLLLKAFYYNMVKVKDQHFAEKLCIASCSLL